MTAQIIFFLALALLIILIARRVSITAKMPSQFSAIGKQLLGLGKQIGGSVAEQAKKVSGFRPHEALPSKAHKSTPFTVGGNGFWQDQSLDEKPELSSNFEEGDVLFKQGKYDEAERFFIKAAASKPGEPKIYARLGVIYLNKKNYNDAIEALKVAVKLDKYNPSRHYNLALAYWGNKDKQRATISVREAIGLDPVTPKYRQFLEQLLESK